jgi:hypothetical protein
MGRTRKPSGVKTNIMSELILEQASADLVVNKTDAYPSRNGQNAKLINRQDPIVYASKEQRPPIDRSLINTYNQQGYIVLDNVFTHEIATYK